jgi:hypothetical protein
LRPAWEDDSLEEKDAQTVFSIGRKFPFDFPQWAQRSLLQNRDKLFHVKTRPPHVKIHFRTGQKSPQTGS